MWQFILITLAYIAYIELNAIEDSKLAKLGGLNHQWNWILTAWVGLICSYALYDLSLEMITYAGFLVPITWIIFDWAVNYHLGKRGKEVFTYMGTGGWDLFFKNRFGNDALKAMYITKGFLLVIMTILHILI